VYSLCSCLSGLFAGRDDGMSLGALEILATGREEAPERRCELSELDRSLSELLGDSIAPPPAPPARFWTEDQIVRFNGRDYRIITRLGSGGVGTTFKVVEVDRSTKEDLGTYVAKVAHESESGSRVLRAYSLARSHLGRNEALSPIYESALEWQENQFISLLGWIEGTPLSEFTGVFSLLAEELDESSPESLAINLLERICSALDVLHRNGLSHGDVSPRNMIVSGNSLVLTDYDFVTRIGEAATSPGTVAYCCPSRERKQPTSPADDIFAAAGSFFHVLFEKEPFRYGGELLKERGLNWKDVDRAQYPILAAIFDKATHLDPVKRYASATELLLSPR
jgi:serine/threonine protein kinase